MRAKQYILIQIEASDEFYEVARIIPYSILNDPNDVTKGWVFDTQAGFYCEGIAQNNGRIVWFNLHLGDTEQLRKYNHILLEEPFEYLVPVKVKF